MGKGRKRWGREKEAAAAAVQGQGRGRERESAPVHGALVRLALDGSILADGQDDSQHVDWRLAADVAQQLADRHQVQRRHHGARDRVRVLALKHLRAGGRVAGGARACVGACVRAREQSEQSGHGG